MAPVAPNGKDCTMAAVVVGARHLAVSPAASNARWVASFDGLAANGYRRQPFLTWTK